MGQFSLLSVWQFRDLVEQAFQASCHGGVRIHDARATRLVSIQVEGDYRTRIFVWIWNFTTVDRREMGSIDPLRSSSHCISDYECTKPSEDCHHIRCSRTRVSF